METEGFVSLWLGNVRTDEELERLLEVSYAEEDDELPPSIFAKHFEIPEYDEDFREAEFLEDVERDLDHLLQGFSYDDIIIPRFKALVQEVLPDKVNAVVLLYNFKYTGKIVEATMETNTFKYVGTVEYK